MQLQGTHAPRPPGRASVTVQEMIDKNALTLIRESELFDADWYVRTYPDVSSSGLSPAEHYLRFGIPLGRDPGPAFSSDLYLRHNPDVAERGVPALVHYERHGRTGKRRIHSAEAGHPGVDPAIAASSIDRRRLKFTRQEARTELSRILTEEAPAKVRRMLPKFDGDKARLFVDCLMSLPGEELAARKVKASVVLPTYNRAHTLGRAIASALEQSHHNLELLVVDDGSTDGSESVLASYAHDPRLRVFRNPHLGVSAARNTALEHATGDVIFYLDSDNAWMPDFVRLMIMAMRIGDAECAFAAMRVEKSNGTLMGYRGEPFDRDQCIAGNYVDMNVFCHSRDLTNRYGAFDPTLKRTVDWDLILRYTRTERMVYCPIVGCNYIHDEEDPTRISVTQPFLFRHLVQDKHRADFATTAEAVAAMKLRFAIKIAAPYGNREAWGDYHFAESLKEALEHQGHEARVDFVGEWDKTDRGDDHVAIVLRGLAKYTPAPGQLSLMWNISHPDLISFEEYDSFDGIFVASSSWAALLTQVLGRPVETLLQCTDRNRFAYEPKPPPQTGEGVFVGNSHKICRDIVRWSVEEGLPLAVHGQHWEGFIPDAMIRSQNIPNRQLAGTYAGAPFVLNDHWTSMRDFGLVSNRVFDVLGCGGRLVSDDMPAIRALFGEAVTTVRNKAEFREKMAEGIRPLPPTQRRAAAQKVFREHTFDARARSIVTWVRNYLSGAETSRVVQEKPAVTLTRVGLLLQRGRAWPTSSAFIRLIAPLTTDEASHKVSIVQLESVDDPRLDEMDACIVQRVAVPDMESAHRLLDRLRQRGTPLFIDSDDAFNSHADYAAQDKALRHLMSAAEEVWLSTPTLEACYRDISRPKRVIRNEIEPRFWRGYRNPVKTEFGDGVVRFLYMGTATHDRDFAQVLPAFRKLAESHPGQFELVLVGAVRNPPVAPWLRRASPPPLSGAYPDFVAWLRTQGPFDVGIAPLQDSAFNHSKSDVKFLDYSALGLLSVLSDCPAYENVLSQGLALGCGQDPEDWYRNFVRILESRSEFDVMRKTAQDHTWNLRSTLSSVSPMVAAITAAVERQRSLSASLQDGDPNKPANVFSLAEGWADLSDTAPLLSESFEQQWREVFLARARHASQERYSLYFGVLPDEGTPQVRRICCADPRSTADHVMRAASGIVLHRCLWVEHSRSSDGDLSEDEAARVSFDRMMWDLGLDTLVESEHAGHLDKPAPGVVTVLEGKDAAHPTLVIFAETIDHRFAALFATRFSRIVLVRQSQLDHAIILREQPEFVIALQTERSLFNPPEDVLTGVVTKRDVLKRATI